MGHDNDWMGKLTFVACVVILILLLKSNPTQPTTDNTLSVSGSYLLLVSPDEAEVLLRVQTIEDTAALSQSKNKEISTKVIDSLKALGIKQESISTQSYNLFKKEEYVYSKNDVNNMPPPATLEFKGYELDHVIKVKSNDLENLGKVVDSAIEAGANGVDSVTFKLSKTKEKEIKQQVLATAIQNAKDKATIMASSLSVKLDKPLNVYESYYNIQPYNSYNTLKSADIGMAQSSTMITPGDVEVSMSVSINYKIK